MDLGGTFTLADLGTFHRTGGTVNLTGTLNNAGHAGPRRYHRELAGARRHDRRRHGATAGAAELVGTAYGKGTLAGVTLAGTLDMASRATTRWA